MNKYFIDARDGIWGPTGDVRGRDAQMISNLQGRTFRETIIGTCMGSDMSLYWIHDGNFYDVIIGGG